MQLLNLAVTLHRRWRGKSKTDDDDDDGDDADLDSNGAPSSITTPQTPQTTATTTTPEVGLTPQNFEEMEYEVKQLISFIQAFLGSVIKRGSFPHLKGFALEMLPW